MSTSDVTEATGGDTRAASGETADSALVGEILANLDAQRERDQVFRQALLAALTAK